MQHQIVSREAWLAGRLDHLRAAGSVGGLADRWPQLSKGVHPYRIDRRPIVQWPRIEAGCSDILGTTAR